MRPDAVKITLESKQVGSKHTFAVSTNITAYLVDGDVFDKNTIVFDCDPFGSNYRRTYFEAKFADWTSVYQIREFLSHHFSDIEGKTRELTMPIEEGRYSLQPFDGEPREQDDIDELTVHASEHRIEFCKTAHMNPHIYTYEESVDGEPQDTNYAIELLNFFDEITAEEPIPSTEKSEDKDIHRLFNEYTVSAQLEAIAEPDDQILVDYEKAVREFKDQEYSDVVRDVGRTGETLIEELCHRLYGEKGTPDGMTARLNKLDKTEEGLPSYIGKAVSPAWWLRNKANHPSEYEITKADAHYALLCFQTAVEKYIEEYLDEDVTFGGSTE